MTGTAGGCQGDQGVTQRRVCLCRDGYRLPDLTPDPALTSVYLCLVRLRGALLNPFVTELRPGCAEEPDGERTRAERKHEKGKRENGSVADQDDGCKDQ